ncbi:hypothetical protein, partial [Zavarzinella formosa]|uniref:hypothetical protein n=1 Tax=Zavarzinella formosa TaxID=360055 RepID=UPI0012F840F8
MASGLPTSEDPSALAVSARESARGQGESIRKAADDQKLAWQTLDKRIETFQKEIPPDVTPTLPPPPKNTGDAFKTLSDLSAAWA